MSDNLETLIDYCIETKDETNGLVSIDWLLKQLRMIRDADRDGVLINPAYLRATHGIRFALEGQELINIGPFPNSP